MKIGILTYHTSHNYGAFLQAYALREEVSKLPGVQAEIIDFTMARAVKKNKTASLAPKRHPLILLANRRRYAMFNNSVARYQTMSPHIVTDDLDQINRFIAEQGYDAVIAGSDEVWKLDGYRGFPTAYWLTDPKATYKKFAYAVSSRTPLDKVTSETREKVASFVERFAFIGVRDDPTRELVDACSGGKKEIHLTCDPTFLHDFKADRERGKAILRDRFGIKDDGKKVVALMSESEALAQAALSHKDEFHFAPLYSFFPCTGGPYIPDPFEWIDVIAACDGMITTYFHGTVFSIKNNVPFASFERRNVADSRSSKIFDVLDRHGEAARFHRLNDPKLDLKKAVSAFLENVKAGDKVDFSELCRGEKALSDGFFEALQK